VVVTPTFALPETRGDGMSLIRAKHVTTDNTIVQILSLGVIKTPSGCLLPSTLPASNRPVQSFRKLEQTFENENLEKRGVDQEKHKILF
jgi:hypothetical protein